MKRARIGAFALGFVLLSCADDRPVTTDPTDVTASEMSIMAVTNWYVKPSGLIGNSGLSTSSAWPLSYALNGAGGRIQPGDTVWMLGGTYGPDSSYEARDLSGNVSSRVVFKQYPGQRATIDGQLQVYASYLTFWGFELLQSNPTSHPEWYLIESYEGSFGARYIRLFIHDAAKSGILLHWPQGDAEAHGNIVFNNGEDNQDHGIYVQGSVGGKYVRTNVIFNNLAYGVHSYSEAEIGHPPLANISIVNNMSFNNGLISPNGAKSNIFIGSTATGSTALLASSNVAYYSGLTGTGISMGLPQATGSDMIVEYNKMLGGSRGLQVYNFNSAVVRYDTIAGDNVLPWDPDIPVDFKDPTSANYQWYGNVYFHSPTRQSWLAYYQTDPDGQFIDLATFLSLTGFNTQSPVDVGTTATYGLHWWLKDITHVSNERFLAVYNPGGGSPVTIPLGSGWLVSGNQYTLYNVQKDVYGNPVASGTYNGSSLSVPMTGVTPPVPVQASQRGLVTAPTTGPTWHVFLLRKG